MGRKRKSVDAKRAFKVPKSLQNGLEDLLNSVSEKSITKLQYTYHLRLIEEVYTRQDLKNNTEGWVPLDAKIMVQTISSSYSNCLRNLEKAGVFEVLKDSQGRPKYSVINHEAKQYRFTDTFRYDEEGEIEGIVRVFKNKPKKDIIDINTKRLLTDIVGFPEYALLRNWLHKVKIDVETFDAEGQAWVSEGVLIKNEQYTQERHRMYLAKCETLNGDNVKFIVGYGNRGYTNLTETPKVTRKHLRIEGYSGTLYQSDLISAHVLLAVPLLRVYQAELTCSEARSELDQVIRMVGSKEFYKRLSNELRAEGVTVRDEKTEFLKQVWNAEEYRYQVTTPYRVAFNKLYPTFNEFIKRQKQGKDGNKEFAHRLTKIESELFNNRIAHRVALELGMDTCLLGIFDSFIYKEEDKEAIVRIMNEETYMVTGIDNMVKTTTLLEESEKVVAYPKSCVTAINEDINTASRVKGMEAVGACEQSSSVLRPNNKLSNIEEKYEGSNNGLENEMTEKLKSVSDGKWDSYLSQIYLVISLGDTFLELSYEELNTKIKEDRFKFESDEKHRVEWLDVVGKWKANKLAKAC